MSKLKLLNGDVVNVKIVKSVKDCPSEKMAVWHDKYGRLTTGVKKISRGNYVEIA